MRLKLFKRTGLSFLLLAVACTMFLFRNQQISSNITHTWYDAGGAVAIRSPLVAFERDDGIAIWDIRSYKEVDYINTSAREIEFASDREIVILGYSNKDSYDVRTYDLSQRAEYQLSCTRNMHNKYILICQRESYLVIIMSRSSKSSMHIIENKNFETLVYSQNFRNVVNIDFNESGSIVALINKETDIVKIMNMGDETIVSELDISYLEPRSFGTESSPIDLRSFVLGFSPNSEILLVDADNNTSGSPTLWNISSSTALQELPEHTIHHIDFSYDNNYLISCGYDLIIWDISTAEEKFRHSIGLEGMCLDAQFNTYDNSYIYSLDARNRPEYTSIVKLPK